MTGVVNNVDQRCLSQGNATVYICFSWDSLVSDLLESIDQYGIYL